MARFLIIALSALLGRSSAQSPADILGAELDAPMVGSGGRAGPGAMLRFGCSQVVIERLDPFVNDYSLDVASCIVATDSPLASLTLGNLHQRTCTRSLAAYVTHPAIPTSY